MRYPSSKEPGLLLCGRVISMSIFRRRPYIFLAIAVFLLSVWFYIFQYEPPMRQVYLGPKVSFDGQWNYTRDARNLLMNDTQCDQAFPELFKEIDRAVESRKKHHIGIGEMDLIPHDLGYIRGMIYDDQLYIISIGEEVNSRGQATLHALHRAIITSPEPLPNIEFTIMTDDIAEQAATWAYSRQESDDKIWLIPDFGYWAWPEPKVGSYHEVQMKAAEMDVKVPWEKKIEKLIWRGAVMDLDVRWKLLNATAGKDWADVMLVNWEDESDPEKPHHIISMAQHCQYKFVAHTEGVSYSARLQNLQNCMSVIVTHELRWLQHHHHLMVSSGPNQNFVQAGTNFSDLTVTMERLLHEPDEQVKKIAENNVRTFREHYLTPAAETCYWRKLVRGWAKVSFEPKFVEKVGKEIKWRGVPVESFLLMKKIDWDPY